jgi:hypothetical protein
LFVIEGTATIEEHEHAVNGTQEEKKRKYRRVEGRE